MGFIGPNCRRFYKIVPCNSKITPKMENEKFERFSCELRLRPDNERIFLAGGEFDPTSAFFKPLVPSLAVTFKLAHPTSKRDDLIN